MTILSGHPELPVSTLTCIKLKKWEFPPVLSPWEASFFCRDSRYFQPKVTLSDNSVLLLGFYFLFLVFEDSFQRPPDGRLFSYSSGFCSQRVLVELEKQYLMYIRRSYYVPDVILNTHWLLFNS